MLHPWAYDDLRPWDWTSGKKEHLSPFVSTPCPSTRIGPGNPVFQRASGSPNQASLDHHFEDVGSRPVYGPSDFDLSKVIWRGIVSAPSSEVRTSVKGSRGKCTRRTPLPCPLRTTTFEARYLPALLLCPVPRTNFAPAVSRSRTTLQGCRWVRHSSRRALAGGRHPSRHPTADLRFYQNSSWHLLLFLPLNRLLQSQYVQLAGHRLISLAYAETFALTRSAQGTPRRARLASSSLSLRSRGSKART